MRNTRAIVAVTLLATALCADRASASAPAQRAQREVPAARTFTQRLTVSLRRVVPAVRLNLARREGLAQSSAPQSPTPCPTIHTIQGQAFEFRLPPPLA
jgi:hypothetical protein